MMCRELEKCAHVSYVFSQHVHIRLIGDRVGSIYTVTLRIHASPHKFPAICCV